jgi:hypothetical protein
MRLAQDKVYQIREAERRMADLSCGEVTQAGCRQRMRRKYTSLSVRFLIPEPVIKMALVHEFWENAQVAESSPHRLIAVGAGELEVEHCTAGAVLRCMLHGGLGAGRTHLAPFL